MTELEDIVDELFGLRPAWWTMVQQTSETILKLAELGNAIIIGRDGNVITAKRPNVLHVRLVAPLAARAFCLREDADRRLYLRKYRKEEIDDPLLYHLRLNTGLVGFEEAARLIAEAVQGLGISAGGGMSNAGITHPSAALAHRAELQHTQLVRL